MTTETLGRRLLVGLVVATVVLAAVPTTVAAKTTVRPTVTVSARETVEDDLTAVARTVLVLGTVDGDVTALAGNVVVNGEVTGDVTAVGGRVEVTGRIGGTVTAITATTVARGRIDGDLDTIGGSLTLEGRVAGTVDATGLTVTVAENATVGGRLITTALRTQVNGTVRGVEASASVGPAGDSRQVETVDGRPDGPSTVATSPANSPASDRPVSPRPALPVLAALVPVPLQFLARRWFDVTLLQWYGFVANLLLGVVLVGLLPRSSGRVAATVERDPVRTWLVGVAVAFVVPIALLAVGLSLFGLPLALAEAAVFVVLSWVGAVYGRFAVGMWLLGAVPRALAYADVEVEPVENRWAGLLVGAVVVGLLVLVPYLGPVVEGVVAALGLGAVARLVYGAYRRTERPASGGTARVATDGSDGTGGGASTTEDPAVEEEPTAEDPAAEEEP